MDVNQFTENNRTALVRREWSLTLAAALLDEIKGEPMDRGGRGEIVRFPFEGGCGILRRCRRGGLVRHFLHDAYLLQNRPLVEWRAHCFAYEHGLAVPEPLGVVWERRGPLFKGALATREVPGEALLDRLAAEPGDESLPRAAGALIRRMHDMGVLHADLNARNFIVGPEGVHVLDFDNAVVAPRVSRLQRARNLLRLKRSLDKARIPHICFEAICTGYGFDLIPAWLAKLYALKGWASNLLAGRGSAHGH